MSKNSRVAFLGLGVMGYPMARHLKAFGHDVTVYNRTKLKAQSWVKENGGSLQATPREAARGQDFVFMCVGNDDDVRSVVFGRDGVLAGTDPGTILVDHTTASAEVARELDAAAKAKEVAFLDAPVSGGQVGAENGQLTVMLGGAQEVYEIAEPIIQCYAKRSALMGPVGSGQLTKMVNQIAIAGLVQGLSEAMNFGAKAGLCMGKVIDVLSKGAAQSWQMDNRGTTMVEGEFDFGFAVDWMRKDLAICIAEARQNGARLPVATLVDQFYSQVQAKGGGRWDSSSLIHLLAHD